MDNWAELSKMPSSTSKKSNAIAKTRLPYGSNLALFDQQISEGYRNEMIIVSVSSTPACDGLSGVDFERTVRLRILIFSISPTLNTRNLPEGLTSRISLLLRCCFS
jgi:hypothetical protein